MKNKSLAKPFLIFSALVLAVLAASLSLVLLTKGNAQTLRRTDTAQSLASGNLDQGRATITDKGCAGCHDIPGIQGAKGQVGPSLSKFKDQLMIAGVLKNSEKNLIEWLKNPRKVDPLTSMPDLGLSDTEARDIAAYLYSLP